MKPIFLLTSLAGLGLGTAIAEQEPFTINTLKGAKYEKCRVLKVDPDGICFAHDRGTAKVPFVHLGPEWHSRFNFDEGKAKDFVRDHTSRPGARHGADESRRSVGRRSVEVVDHGYGGGDFDFSDAPVERSRRFGSRGGLVDRGGGDSDFSDTSTRGRRFGSRGGLVHGSRSDGDHRRGHDSHRRDPSLRGTVPFDFRHHLGREFFDPIFNRHFPVHPFLTFGGYSYPNGWSPFLTGTAFDGTGFHSGFGHGFGGFGHGFGGFGHKFHSNFPRNPFVLPSGGMRGGGTGGLIQARSGGISHR